MMLPSKSCSLFGGVGRCGGRGGRGGGCVLRRIWLSQGNYELSEAVYGRVNIRTDCLSDLRPGQIISK